VNEGSAPALPRQASRRGVAVAGVACVAIAAIACGQALVAHPPSLWFDVDPAADPNPFAGIAPSTGLLLDSLSVALAAIAIALAARTANRRSGDRSFDLLSAALIATGLPLAIYALQEGATLTGDGALRLRYGAVLNLPAPDLAAWPDGYVVPGAGGPPNSPT
jgi:hypothetical protein